MSKAKRNRQKTRRGAFVHRYLVRQGLIACEIVGCPSCGIEATR